MRTATAHAVRERALAMALLWLAGNALRITILAVPPVIALIRDDLRLNATQVGLLSSVPPALFALAALAGSLLVARLGLMAALVGGLAMVAVGSSLRGLSTTFATLLATSTLMSAGVAIMQPIMPTAVRAWLPRNIGLGTAIYTNGLLTGETFPVLLTIPIVLPLVGNDWRFALVAWSLPIAAIALIVYFLAPASPASPGARGAPAAKWLPDWHRGLVWRLGVLFCCLNAIYFATNGFVPIYLANQGRSDLIGETLTALNLSQLPASLVLLALAHKLEGRSWPYFASGLLSLLSIGGLVLMVGPTTIVWASLLGFSEGAVFTVGLALPPLLCRHEDVARTAAGMFTISYAGAVAIAIVSGLIWDLTGMAAAGFAPIALCALGQIATAGMMQARKELR
jgi:MFS transporter, CP family, cyanate transporter